MARLLRFAILMACFLYAGRVLAAGGTCPSGANYWDASGQQLVTLSSLGVTGCYYIAANGSDSNSGTSESSPWAHLPGMLTCGGNCAAHTPSAGEGYVLRGGDTWGGANLGATWNWGGSATNPIYIGVDPSWSSEGSWARPILSCGGTQCAANGYFLKLSKPYVIVDNLEFTGLQETTTVSPQYLTVCTSNATMENIYMHGWSHQNPTQGGNNSQGFAIGCGTNNAGDTVRYSVIDGSDTTRDMFTAMRLAIPNAYGNYMNYLVSGMTGCGDNWHDNIVENGVISYIGLSHQDAIYQYGPCYSSTVFMYNNVVRNYTFAGSGGAVKFWMSGNNANTATGYAYNNVIYNVLPGNIVDVGGHFAVPYGTWYFFNNTVECGTDSNPGGCLIGDNGNTGGSMTLHLSDNHWITTGSILSCTKTYVCTEANDVLQTVSQAKSQGYSDASAYAFQPTSASGSTVTSIANAAAVSTRQSLCTTIGIIDSRAGAACQSDTSYACTYDTTNHTMRCPARQTVARAAEPNVGAYQFSSVEASTPNPPAGLTVSVQ